MKSNNQIWLCLLFSIVIYPILGIAQTDTIPPVAVASVDTVFLDSTGIAILTADVFGANSTDNVGIANYSFERDDYDSLGSSLSQNQSYRKFGRSVSLSKDGQTMAVGSWGLTNQYAGLVQTYTWSGTAWVQKGNGLQGTTYEFACNVELSADGNTLAIGAPHHGRSDQASIGNGRIKIFQWNGNDWITKGARIEADTNWFLFGNDLSISDDGNTIAIGAYQNEGIDTNAGRAEIYQWNGTAWVQKGQTITGAVNRDRLGYRVDLSANGNVLAVTSRRGDGLNGQSGKVQVFVWNGTSWVQRGTTFQGTNFYAGFGSDISLSDDGSIIAIGASYGGPNTTGMVKVYSWTGSLWLQRGATLYGQGTQDNFGHSLCLSRNGKRLVVGATEPLTGSSADSGYVSFYEWSGFSWQKYASDITGPRNRSNIGFDIDIASEAGIVVAGIPQSHKGGIWSGEVAVFNLLKSDTSLTCTNVGQVDLTLSVSDSAYNTDFVHSTIQVVDNTKPILHLQDVFLYPDTNATITISLSDMLLSSYDNCGIASITFSDSIFSLNNAGANPVTITATDVNGNTTIDTATVWVAETQRPTALTRDTTLYLDQNGLVFLAAADMNNGSYDNTGVVETKLLDTTFTQLGTTIPGYSINDEAGFVDISANGQVMAIGAPRFSGARTLSGHVRVLDWKDTTWVMRGSALELEGEHAQDQSGSALALSADGNILAIGAYRNDDGGSDAGHVRVFYWNGTNWLQRGPDIDGYAAGDQFGYSLDLSGDGSRLIVGARYVNNNAGAVYRYNWNGSAYQLLGTYTGSSSNSEQLGTSVSLSLNGEYLAIGGVGHNLNGINSGAVKVYKQTGPASLSFRGYTYGQNANDRFGTSVAISDDGQTLVVGAPGHDGNGTNAGRVHVFSYIFPLYTPTIGSTFNGKRAGDQYGQRVSLSGNGNIMAVGASDFTVSANDSGYADVFAFDGTSWNNGSWNQWGSTIQASDAGDNAHYVSLSADGSRLALGSWKADAFGTNSGEVRVFEPLKFDTLQYQCHNTNFDFVPLFAADASKNADVAIGSLSILDTLKPSAVARDLTLRIGLPGFIDIDVDDVDSASTDNCEIVFRSISDSSFTSLDSGIVPVVLTVIDASGNVGIDTSWVTVIPPDTIPPTAVTTPQNVYLNNQGLGILQAAIFGANSTDNYGIAHHKLVDVQQLGQTLTGNAQSDKYGEVLELSADGNTLAITTGTYTLANRFVAVYTWSDTAWVQKGTNFTSSTARIGQCLSLSAEGNTLAIGTGFGSGGSGYFTKVYTWNGITWVQKGDSLSNIGIQSSVSLSADGNTILVGDGSQTGSARIFTYNTSSNIWEQKGSTLTRDGLNPGLGGFATFGKSGQIAADGKSFIVGAPGIYSYNKGWAHVVAWDNDSSDWVQRGNYFTGLNAYDRYGRDVSINSNGTIVAISSSSHQVGNKTGAGHVQIFEWDGSQWNQMGSDIEGDSLDAFGEQLGSAIQLNAQGNLITVGSSNKNYLKGKVQSYGYINGQWTAIGQAVNASPSGSSQLGQSVALAANGSRFAVGAPWKSVGTSSTVGTVGVYSLLNDSLHYTCADIDTLTETLWVEDAAGNADFAMDTIVVLDTLGPTLLTQNITVILDGNYQASISVADVDTGSFDNCQLDSLYLNTTSFTCNHLGANTITLYGMDEHGNTSNAAVTVTVKDTVFPIAQAKNVTVYLNANGVASLTAADVDSFSTDLCLLDSLHLSQSQFSCADLGANSIWFYATDGSGNVDSTMTTITVMDTLSPTVSVASQNISVGFCNANVSYALPTFNDNCAVDSIWQSNGLTSGSAFPVGTTTNTFVAQDASGNRDSISFTVTVYGSYLPTLPPLPTICENDIPIDLSGGDTTLVFSGGSVSLNLFDPQQAGVGSHVVNYVFTDTLGCQTTDSLTIMVEAAPVKPTLNTTVAGQLSTQTHSRYQWYRNGALLPGDTLQTLTVMQSGFHQVRVWNAAGCSEISDSSDVTIGLTEIEASSINIYPNPSTGRFVLDLTSHSGVFEVLVYNQAGQLVRTTEVHGAQKSTLDLSALPSGSYNLVLSQDNKDVLNRKVVIVD